MNPIKKNKIAGCLVCSGTRAIGLCSYCLQKLYTYQYKHIYKALKKKKGAILNRSKKA